MNRKQKSRYLKRFWLVAEAVFLVVLLVAVSALIVRLVRQNERTNEERIASRAMEQISAATSGASNIVSSPSDAPSPPPMFEKGEELLAQNPDAVGMVRFADMTLYVCQTSDNFYYAEHRFDGSEDPAGMVFMDCRCSVWPLSDNTVLYGHNMRDGSRFGKLKRYERTDYLEANPLFRFASLYEIHDYELVAIFYTTVDESSAEYFNFAQIEFGSEKAFNEYIDDIRSRSLYDTHTVPSYGDRLLTLATCSSEYDGGRIVIVCREIHDNSE